MTAWPAQSPRVPQESWWGRLRRYWRSYHWGVVGALALLALVLGFVGFHRYLGPGAQTNLEIFYLTLQLFVLESGNITGSAPLSLEVARLLAPAVAGYAVAAVVARIFREELTALRTRLQADHVIICGLAAGWTLAQMLRAAGEKVVAIEVDPSHPRIETCRTRHIPVLVGDARDEHVLRKAGIRRASRLIAVCGDDGTNIKVAEQSRRLAPERDRVRLRPPGRPLRILVHVVDPHLCSLLTLQEMDRADCRHARLDFFSLYAGGARALLSQYAVTAGAGGHTATPHLLVVGLGRLGRQLVVQAARNWRSEDHTSDEGLWITVAAQEAVRKLEELRRRHPFLDRTCELNAVELPDAPLSLPASAVVDASGRPPVSSIYVCLPDDPQSLGVALSLHRELRHRSVPVVVRTYDSDLAALLPGVDETDGAGLYVFDQLERTCRPDQLFAGNTERLARTIHDTYVRQQRARGATPETNPSLVEWSQLTRAKKDTNWEQAEHIPVKLAAIGCEMRPLTDADADLFTFTPDEVEHLARLEHDRWTDSAAPEHPANVPWEELDEPTREIDRNFVRRMPALLTTVGLQINRLDRRPQPAHKPA
jgi:hypothetical protein